MRTVNTNDWPEVANRRSWSKLLHIHLNTLIYNYVKGKLKGRKEDYYVMHTREQIVDWLVKTRRVKYID